MKLVRKTATAAVLLSSLCLSSGRLFAAEKAVLQARATATQPVSFDIFLPLQHREQLESLLADLHDSKSANYQHWLTPDQFEARFGINETQADAIVSELAMRHLTATRTSTRHLVVTGAAADVEHAFNTILKNLSRGALVGHSGVCVVQRFLCQGLIDGNGGLQVRGWTTGNSRCRF